MNDATVYITGKLVADPKSTQTNGMSRLSFGVSVMTTRKPEGAKYYETDIYNVTLFGKTADYNQERLQKGTEVDVCGDMMMYTYKNRNGENVTSPSVRGNKIKIRGGAKPYNGNNNNNNNDDEDSPF